MKSPLSSRRVPALRIAAALAMCGALAACGGAQDTDEQPEPAVTGEQSPAEDAPADELSDSDDAAADDTTQDSGDSEDPTQNAGDAEEAALDDILPDTVGEWVRLEPQQVVDSGIVPGAETAEDLNESQAVGEEFGLAQIEGVEYADGEVPTVVELAWYGPAAEADSGDVTQLGVLVVGDLPEAVDGREALEDAFAAQAAGLSDQGVTVPDDAVMMDGADQGRVDAIVGSFYISALGVDQNENPAPAFTQAYRDVVAPLAVPCADAGTC